MIGWKTGISDDYAIMRGGKYQFYYGYEETDDNDEWMFVVSEGDKDHLRLTAIDMDLDPEAEPVLILLEGISLWLDQSNPTQET